jgi:type III restriction enzyme
MQLKDYQLKVLEYLETYLETLAGQYQGKLEYYEFQKSKGKEVNHPETSDYCQETWTKIKSSLAIQSPIYTTRQDGLGRNIPNICFKVPTGGGKTLLATHALQRIKQDYFKTNNGFVLWICPSETIYTQTSKALRNKEHPYRQMLDRISGGKTMIFDKNDRFNKADVEGNLCIMLLMLQSGNRDNKETLRMFRDSGKFTSFFPDVDDYNSNKELLVKVPNLETSNLIEGIEDVVPNVLSGLSIKHSLGNVLKLIRPVVIMDEGHKAASNLALETLNGFNPSFILELSATPKNSNVLISVKGEELKKEQMIKLPINLFSYEKSDWKQTINYSHQKLQELSNLSTILQKDEGRYIRPIMLIKVESKKPNDSYDMAQDVKKYLIDNLGVAETEIRIKLSEKDEIKDEDLFHKLCPVKYIITKDALKEGWDCSFAYILAILANTKSNTALTQFIGRVLRQPQAKETKFKELNQCYVYCNKSDVNEAVEKIKEGLEKEGMGDLKNDINSNNNENNSSKIVQLKIKDQFKNQKIFLPKLNVFDGKEVRAFDYYQDILADIKWQNYNFDKEIILENKNTFDYSLVEIDVKTKDDKQLELLRKNEEQKSEQLESKIDIALMVSQLMDKIPNPWQATNLINLVLEKLKIKYSQEIISLNSVYIVGEVKKDCLNWLLEKSENIFKEKLEAGIIFLKLIAEPFSNLNWQMEEVINTTVGGNEAPIILDKNIFEPCYKSLYNGDEYKIASYINKSEAVKWWHRLGVKGTNYFVSGWKKDKIFPDFLVKMENENGISKFQFIETKGDHLEGNKDTKYKQKVFEYLNDLAKKEFHKVGELKLIENKDELNFQMIFEDSWESDIKNWQLSLYNKVN